MHIAIRNRLSGFGSRPARFLAGLVFLTALCSGGAHAAIALVVVPDEAFDSPGNAATNEPFGATASCTDGMRFQQVFNGDAVGSGNISSIGFRLDDGESEFGPFTYEGVTVKLSSTTRTPGNMSKTFADNIGPDQTLVFKGDLDLSGSTSGDPTNPFDIQLPVEVPFEFDGSSANLLLDVTVESCPPGADGVVFDGDTRDVKAEYAFDKDAASAEASTAAGGLVTELTLSSPPPIAPLYSCPFDASGGDGLSRGFYVENFPGERLDRVRLQYDVNQGGFYTIELTAREDSYDGRLIGRRTVSFNAAAGGETIRRTYDFGGATVSNGATVTFSQAVVNAPSGASVFYDNASDSGGCTDITQTNGTSPPLDSVRRDSVGLQIDAATRLRGLGGNWEVLGNTGEGFMVDVTETNQLVAIWFTYDDAGNQMWLIGVAENFDQNQATMTVDRISGPVFGPDFDPGDIVTEGWGTVSFLFDDCSSGQVYYNSVTGFGDGVYDISKVYRTEQQLCE